MRRKPVDSGADRGMRAYVTSGCTANDDARRSAVHARNGPHATCVWRARGSRHTSGARVTRAACTARWRRSRGGARVTAGDACAISAGITASTVASSGKRGDAMVPVAIDADARLRIAAAHGHRRFRYPEVAPGVPILRQARDRYAASDATSVHDRANMLTLLGLFEEPGARVMREYRATPRAMSSDGPSPGRHTSLYCLKDSETSLRPPWGRP